MDKEWITAFQVHVSMLSGYPFVLVVKCIPMAKQVNPDLTDEQKHVLFEAGTEAPFSGEFVNHNAKGLFTRINCGVELFASDSKYDSNMPGLAGMAQFCGCRKTGSGGTERR